MAPNIILIVADDQPKGTLSAMPNVRELIKDQGVDLTNAISQTALCSPARSSLLTGNYSHNTGVWTNYGDDPDGAWLAFKSSKQPGGGDNEADTVATRLSGAGYHTALVGKYLNKYSDAGGAYVPAGWDHFTTMISDGNAGGSGAYYNYTLVGSDEDEHHGSDPSDYSTDVLLEKAVGVVRDAPVDKPLFLMFTPWGPHGNYEPAPRHLGTFAGKVDLPGSFNEDDMSDKPDWMQRLPLVDRAHTVDSYKRIHEALMSIDEAVGTLVGALGSRLEDCLIIYASDNGKMMGSHRSDKKDLPHRWAAEVPTMIRWKGHIDPGTSSTRITPNVDITATIAEAAGISTHDWKMDGESYLSRNRMGTLVEQKDNPEQKHPAYVGWRTKRYLYVEYTSGVSKGRELYDYVTDPQELNNLAYDPAHAQLAATLRAKAEKACVPTPPGFEWSF